MGELESSSRKRLTLLIDCSRQLFVLYATFISRYVVSRRSKSMVPSSRVLIHHFSPANFSLFPNFVWLC